MPQENEKTSDVDAEPQTTLKDRQGSTERKSEDRRNLDKQQVHAADAKEKEDNLKLREDFDDMPELKDDHGVQEDMEISLDLSEPPPEIMEYAKRELGETDEVKCQTLQEFRDMIYGNLNLNESEIEMMSML